MPEVSGLKFEWLEFDKKGKLKKAMPSVPEGATDLLIVSHGWKTDRQGARELYEPLLKNIVAASLLPADRKLAVFGVLWPSRAYDANYADTLGIERVTAAASSAGGDLSREELETLAREFSKFTGTPAAPLLSAADGATRELGARESMRLFEVAVGSVEESELDRELDLDLAPFEPEESQRVLQILSAPPLVQRQGGAATVGLDAPSGRLLAGPRAAVGRLLNQLTFFEMKKRAGRVGRGLATSVLPALGKSSLSRIHLAGHSFGARLVTAAAYEAPEPERISSLTLLQGAFSHNAVSRTKRGAFPEAYLKLGGPTLITHTHQDKAVTLAYALASRLSRDTTKAIGDRNDRYGAIGANGALFLTEGHARAVSSDTLVASDLAKGRVTNVLCDAVIKDHMDVANPGAARLVALNLASA